MVYVGKKWYKTHMNAFLPIRMYLVVGGDQMEKNWFTFAVDKQVYALLSKLYADILVNSILH